jgi:hypothetical protein
MFFIVVVVSVGVIRVVVGGGGLGDEIDGWMMEDVLGVGGMKIRERELGTEMEMEMLLLLVVSEEELGEFVTGMIGKSLDSEEVGELRVVLKSDELLDSETRPEENVELLRLGDGLEVKRLLVVEKDTSLLSDEGE